MACTTQSASEYVRSARVHLERELKNLSVIVENLYQQGVFSDEEVSEIKAEKHDFEKNRNLLDSVRSKGEAACYEFLKIINMTRKRTLEKTMHYWISCFPFREDTQMDTNYLQGSRPCHQYQAKLKSKAHKISNEFWKSNKSLFEENKPDLSYSSLVLDTQGSPSPSKIKKFKNKKSKMSRPKKMKTYIPEDRSEMSPSKLLELNEDILLVGEPGIGKTTLSHELLKLWAERDSKKLDYMFYFDMRETSHITKDMSLEDLLFSVFSEPDEGKEEVLKDIKKYSDNVTIIFDGVTHLSSSVVQRIVEKDLLPDAKVIVTCRPDDEEDLFSGDSLRVEVKGFSEQSVRTYIAETLGEEQGNVLRNVELLTLCHVPMYALMVAACFSFQTPEDSPQPNSVTEIYINIVRHCLQINSNKTTNRHLDLFIKSKREEILSLAEAAFHATEGKTVNMTEFQCKDSCVLSFLKTLDNKVGSTKTVTTYAFLHYTMQEFFAALWLLKNPDKIKDVFQQCLTEEKKHMKHLIPFMCRLLTEESPSLMKCLIPDQQLKKTSEWFLEEMINTFSPHLCKKDEAGTDDSGLDVDILFYCQCLYESQCPEQCVDFLDRLDYDLDLSGESLSPYSCCAVAYVVNQSSKRKIWLNLEGSELSEQGMRRLFGCLQNVQCSRTTNRGVRLQEQEQCRWTPERKSKQLLLDLCLKAALHKGESFHDVVNTLFSLFSVNTDLNNILLDFYQHVVSERSLSVIPKLVTLFQSAPAVWSINLSERKSSILLEVLKLTSGKKQVKLTGCSHEESEVRSFLQCLPHISQLR
uniref:CARD domain-containing protein n=1 Tax=Sparus aurata TaxID=8175 RepID=A0A671Z0Y8_SPAAU